MSEQNESDYEAFYEDLEVLVNTLQKVLGSERSRYYYNDQENSLFVEIEGLEELEEDEIQEATEHVLDEMDLDFDEVMLLPFKE